MRKSVFLTKAKTSVFHCRISEELQQRLQAVQSGLKKLGGEAVFPVDQIVEEALERAAKLAEVELSKRTSGTTAAKASASG